MTSAAFIKNAFREYYGNHPLNAVFASIQKREFGFALFEGWMLRHKSFKDCGELRSFLCNNVPRDAYVSCAYYEDAEAEMERKGWLGADLIFDIDADHIPTTCDKLHDKWRCCKCGFDGKGVTPEKCPVCECEKFEESTWPCEVCLDSAKHETIKLLDMLLHDFGFPQEELHTSFSGNRGYHVQIDNEATKSLDTVSRKEIVDYVSGLGFDINFHGIGNGMLSAHRMPRCSCLPESGWDERITRRLRDFVLVATEDDYRMWGVNKQIMKILMKNRDKVVKNLGSGTGFSGIKGVGVDTWRKMVEFCVAIERANVDTVVTTDVHRLIRLPDTLHGKTGLQKMEFSPSRITEFDPFEDAVAFRNGTVTIFVSETPEFRICGEVFGPFRNQKVDLPAGAAMLLLCRGRAEVAQ